jgi:PTH1 family peptidyl-tRNA hydrolase
MTSRVFGAEQPAIEGDSDSGRDDRHGYLVVGLGNPGGRYRNTRHNAGGMAIEHLARKHTIAMDARRANALVGTGSIEGTEVTLAIPQTFMNVSGESIGPLARRTNTPVSKVLIVYDDLDLPLGKTRLRPYGSAGGHNGMRSVITALRTDRFPRLRIGIGRPEASGRDAIGHVLGRFSSDEEAMLNEALSRTAECVEALVGEGLERAMNKFN